MRYDIDKIRAIPVLDVAKELGVEVKRKGTRYMAKCLWHADGNASLEIGGKYNNCYCYACQKSFDGVALVEKVLGVDFLGALEWFGERYGVTHSDSPKGEESHPVGWKTRRLEALVARGRNNEHRDAETQSFFVNQEWLQARMTMDNSFVMCMKEVFGGNVAAQVVRDYSLCSVDARFGVKDVGFPLIDVHGRIRDIKVQGYQWDRRSDRFFHGNGVCYWLGKTLPNPPYREGAESFFDHQCLFGEHLLNGSNRQKIVVLVESPKNACVGSAIYPEYVWVATGNKGMLKREVLEVLRDRRVAVFPDNDAFEEWKDKLDGMRDLATFKVLKVPENVGYKGDIADFIILNQLKNKDYETDINKTI